MSIRILIADDHRILRAGLKTLLSVDPNIEVVGEAISADEAIAAVKLLEPSILLMDIGMPGMDALEATRQVAQISPQTRVLILTMHEDSTLMQEFLRAGASGYIIKRAAESELIDAIYAVWRGIIYVHPSLMRSLVNPPQKQDAHVGTDGDQLTAREVEILRMIVKGYTNRQVASALNISVRTVETHRANLMDKLDLRSRVDLIRYAREHHIVRPDETS
jgi:two-component system response regulator NreC